MYGYNTAHYRDPTAWRAIKRLERWQKKNALESSVRRSDVQDDKSYAKDIKRQEGAFTERIKGKDGGLITWER